MNELRSRHWPRPLVEGDLIALVAPSGPCPPDRLEAAENLLQGWGFRTRRGEHVLDLDDRLTYLAGQDADRAADFTACWADPEVAAVWAVRGGYGAQRMIDLVDHDAVRAAGPKHLIGFSDITALHARIGRELDQITLHGPTATAPQLERPVNADRVRGLLTEGVASGDGLLTGETLATGSATGRLIGGNLTLITADLAIEPPPQVPSIVIFEDVDEESYRLDRQLTQLRRSGWFDSVVGVVLGDFTELDDAPLVDRVLVERLDDLGIPVLWRSALGHAETNLAVPLGAVVRLDADADRAVLTVA